MTTVAIAMILFGSVSMAVMLSLLAMADHVLIWRFRPYYRVEKKKDWAFVCTACKPEKRFAMRSNAPAEHERCRKELFDHLRLAHQL
ncbi:MAG: hypothetical protein ACLQDV_25220 [Candidatus Binataceae bacterium]